MEIIYEAFNFFNKNGFIHLPHLISMNQEVDMEELFLFYSKEKDNEEVVKFLDHYQMEYGLKTVSYKSYVNNTLHDHIYNFGRIFTGECIICYEEHAVGYKTPCNHFMCMECCKKIFQSDYSLKKCPYCRQDVLFYKMAEVLEHFQENGGEEEQERVDDERLHELFIEDEREDGLPYSLNFTRNFNFIRGRIVYDDSD
jgi:hypothetical protein